MARPTFSIPDEELDRLDNVIFQKKIAGEIPRDTSRSEVLRQLVIEWVDEQEKKCEGGNEKVTPTNGL